MDQQLIALSTQLLKVFVFKIDLGYCCLQYSKRIYNQPLHLRNMDYLVVLVQRNHDCSLNLMLGHHQKKYMLFDASNLGNLVHQLQIEMLYCQWCNALPARIAQMPDLQFLLLFHKELQRIGVTKRIGGRSRIENSTDALVMFFDRTGETWRQV